MYFRSIFGVILLVSSALKAACAACNSGGDTAKELKDFAEILKNSEEIKCSLCLDIIKLDIPNFETEYDIKSYMRNRSLVHCFNSVKHISHAECLMPWYVKSFDCPVCRGGLPNNLFTRYLSDTWCNFYNLSEKTQKQLMSEFRFLRAEICIKILEIFKFYFGENRIESFKNHIPVDVPHREELLRDIDRYNVGEKKFLVFISKHLTDQTYDILKKTFTSEKVSGLGPKDLLILCNNLTAFCNTHFSIDLAYDLNINKMLKCEHKFTLQEFADLVDFDIEIKGNFINLQEICYRMRPEVQFDEENVLAYICKMVAKHDILNLDCGSDFMKSIMNFYKIHKVYFYGRLLNYIINNRKIANENWDEKSLQKVFYSIMFISVKRIDYELKLH